MKKMVISLVIEGCEADIHEIKGNIINVAREALVSCSVDEIPEPKKEIQIPAFVNQKCCDRETIKLCLNKLYGKQAFTDTDSVRR